MLESSFRPKSVRISEVPLYSYLVAYVFEGFLSSLFQ